MKKTIDVSIPHRLTRDEARSRLRNGVARYRSDKNAQLASIEENWNDYRMDFKVTALSQSITGRLDVEEEAIKLSVDLPWIFAALAGKIKAQIEQQGRRLLEKK